MRIIWGKQVDESDLKASFKHVSEDIGALQTAQQRLESGLKAIRLEWEDVYDRLNKMVSRLNARIRKSEGQAALESDDQTIPQGTAPPRRGTHDILQEARKRHVLSR